MNESKLWDFTHAPQLCEGFPKVFGKVGIFTDIGTSYVLTSYGSLAFVGLSKFDLHNLSCPPTLPLLLLHLHLGQLCWCKWGDILLIYGIMDLWVMGRRFLMWGC
jgi:hypothetical protein